MNDEQVSKFGIALSDMFFQEQITPKKVIELISTNLSPGNQALVKELAAHWNRCNQERKIKGQAVMDPSQPLHLTRGFGDMVAEDELKHYLPEEKILINKDIFRKKLEGLDFGSLDASRERNLIEELRQESIGLSRDDTMLYFNLLKINSLGKTSSKNAESKAEANIDYATVIVRLTETQFGLSKDDLIKINNGRPVDMLLVTKIVNENIKSNRLNPKVMVNYLGHNTPKYVERMKEFLKLLVGARDGNLNEVLQHFGLYLLLNGTKPELLAKLELSSPLETFVTDRIGRVRQIYYVAMLFAYTMTYVLFVQIYEISSKYQQSADDQKTKLRKLYESEERLAMLVTNAANIASRRIADYKIESREVQTVLKKFLAASKGIVTASDLFSASYDIQ